MTDNVDHPSHYGGKDNPYETIKVIDSWGLDFCLGNAVKYISRAGKKDKDKHIEDLRKAIFYIEHEIELLEGQDKTDPTNTLPEPHQSGMLKPCPFCGMTVHWDDLDGIIHDKIVANCIVDVVRPMDPNSNLPKEFWIKRWNWRVQE